MTRKAEVSSEAKPDDRLFIVGIGASAGGLAALKKFFARVPSDSGLAYVVVVHLSPDHESLLADLLQPHVGIPVEQVTRTVKIEPNRVYVIPPNANLDTVDTHLRLSELEEQRQQRTPVDHFFRTLAATHDGQTVGVVLTGTGSDGTLGVRDIKQANGVCLVQDPADAEFDGMPHSAIATGMVDLVLPVTEIPDAILRIVRTRPQVPTIKEEEEIGEDALRLLQRLFAQLRARTGRDYSRYKRSTIIRRIERRMQLRQVEVLNAYIELLRTDPEEMRVLGDDLLITVTSFFRDPETFEKLERDIVPRLFAGKGAGDDVRVWSVGCATGEEAYSLAILLLEEAERRDSLPRIQVFATDLHDKSLQKAREGFYPGDIETDVSPRRLKRFFVKEGGGYRVRQQLREAVVFAPHNLLADPPFPRLDLISCRNLLIYVQRDLQGEILELFHYALKREGYLLLGTSETADPSNLFSTEDKKQCIYRKRSGAGSEPRLPVVPLAHTRLVRPPGQRHPEGEPSAHGAIHQLMVERYAPPSALVSPDDKLVHLSEHAGRYLVTPGGEPTVGILKLVRRELQIELRAALREARRRHEPVETNPVRVRFNGQTGVVTLRVRPSAEPHQEGFVLIIFDERGETDSSPEPATASAGRAGDSTVDGSDSRVRELEAELTWTQQQLQAVIEEYETSHEEMTASNEEMQSANEELRSTMEEVETSREELESLNEELQTVNEENRHRVEELAQLSSDLQNLLSATDIATLFLDRDLRILRFTPRVGDLFNVRPADRGRPISDLTHRLVNPEIQENAYRVLESLVPVQREVCDEAGRWYLNRVLPYRSVEDRITGVVITFTDITERKRSEEALAVEKKYAESIVETLHEPLLVLTPDLTVRSCNPAFLNHFRVEHATTIGRRVYELGDGQWDIPELRRLLENVLPDSEVFNDYEVTHDFNDIGHRVMLLNGRRLDHVQLILLGIRDITETRQRETARRESEHRYRRLFESIDEGFCVIEVLVDDDEQPYDYRFLELSPAFERHTGIENAVGRTARELVPDQEEEWYRVFGEVARAQEPRRFSRPADALGRYYDVYAFPIDRPEQMRVAVLFRDISEQVRAREELQETARGKDEFLAMLAHELRGPLAPIRAGLEILKASPDDSAKTASVREILERQTKQLVTLVDDLLDVSRISHATLELRRQRITLAQVVRSGVEAARPLVEEAAHDLSVTIPQEPVTLEADPHRLAQVLTNLLSNATRYTPEGGRIWLTAAREGQEIVFAIRDTGVGIPAEMQDRVFDMFAHMPRDRSVAGLGVGLTLVKSLVELHGGSVSLESPGPDEGTTVTVRLPVVVDQADEPSDQTSKGGQESAAGDTANLPALRVLVVDDNKSAADMLGMVLEQMGCEVRVVYSGDAAISAAAESRPQAVVMDIGMPDPDGCEAARRIRREPWGEGITLIALTGWSQKEDLRRTREAGFDHHLVKPPEPEELRDLLARVSSE